MCRIVSKPKGSVNCVDTLSFVQFWGRIIDYINDVNTACMMTASSLLLRCGQIINVILDRRIKYLLFKHELSQSFQKNSGIVP
jgi:hypothetical protein